jgi:FtsZ-binding cell division protein ZapB
MYNSKLQAALDELGRLHDTVKEYKTRNGKLPTPDSDAGRAADSLQVFNDEVNKLDIGKLLK